jgi:ubiquinone/menaquinone biosynthesis C-methylase UbiE
MQAAIHCQTAALLVTSTCTQSYERAEEFSMSQSTGSWAIEDDGSSRVLTIGDRRFTTNYSRNIIELLITRKGPERASQFLVHQAERSWFLKPLFERLNAERRQLRILEVGCSAGHLTEFLNEQPSIAEIYAFDVDKAMVDVARLKRDELSLAKVKRIDHFTVRTTQSLPYENDVFDVVIAAAIVEHLPYEDRHRYVDEYYRVLRVGGLIGFWDTPNRYYPLESHSVGLPLISLLPPQIAYAYARVLKTKMKDVSFPLFVRAGTGWRNSSYYELLPKSLMIDVADVSKEFGYESGSGRIGQLIAKMLRVPPSFFSPSLNVLFRKVRQYE